MNDNDIIKLLKVCSTASGCKDCRFADSTDRAGEVSATALDLIKRQKAEIERLSHIRAELSKEIDRLKAEMSYMKSPNTIGDTHEMGAW